MTLPAPRVMATWHDLVGREVARVLQGVKLAGGRPVVVYFAEVQGDRVERERFQCAVRAVKDWARLNGVHATMVLV